MGDSLCLLLCYQASNVRLNMANVLICIISVHRPSLDHSQKLFQRVSIKKNVNRKWETINIPVHVKLSRESSHPFGQLQWKDSGELLLMWEHPPLLTLHSFMSTRSFQGDISIYTWETADTSFIIQIHWKKDKYFRKVPKSAYQSIQRTLQSHFLMWSKLLDRKHRNHGFLLFCMFRLDKPHSVHFSSAADHRHKLERKHWHRYLPPCRNFNKFGVFLSIPVNSD